MLKQLCRMATSSKVKKKVLMICLPLLLRPEPVASPPHIVRFNASFCRHVCRPIRTSAMQSRRKASKLADDATYAAVNNASCAA